MVLNLLMFLVSILTWGGQSLFLFPLPTALSLLLQHDNDTKSRE